MLTAYSTPPVVEGFGYWNGGPSGSSTYTLTLPQGTPGVSFTSDDVYMGSPGDPYVATWSVQGALGSGSEALSSAGSIASTALPSPQWVPNQCITTFISECGWSLSQSGAISTVAATQSSAAQLTIQVASYVTGDSNVTSLQIQPTFSVVMLDPVNRLQDGNSIVTDPNTLATLGIPVQYIAADGVARVVLRIPAFSVGERLTLTLLDDQDPVNSNPPAGYGTLTSIDGQIVGSPQQLTAVSTMAGPMAFALYIASPNFNYKAMYSSSPARTASFLVQPADLTSVLRPPVFEVHGLWGDPTRWNAFTPLTPITTSGSSPNFWARAANYNFPIGGSIATAVPNYSNNAKATGSSLGILFGAISVLPQFAYTIIEFRATHNAAAAQVDAVGHSMGGLVVRQAEQLAGFLGTDSFGYGYVHELITIGTPHLGSPLAIDMLNGQQPNQCVDGKLAKKGSFAFQTVTLNLDPGTVTWSGAMGDLEGNGIQRVSEPCTHGPTVSRHQPQPRAHCDDSGPGHHWQRWQLCPAGGNNLL